MYKVSSLLCATIAIILYVNVDFATRSIYFTYQCVGEVEIVKRRDQANNESEDEKKNNEFVGGDALWRMSEDGIIDDVLREKEKDPLDLDGRTLLFMVAIAVLMWLLTTLPVAWRVSRVSIVDGLRDDPRVMPVTRRSARSARTTVR